MSAFASGTSASRAGDLAAQWQGLAADWARFWNDAAQHAATAFSSAQRAAAPASVGTPDRQAGIDPAALAELNERFRARFAALAAAAQRASIDGLARDGAKAMESVIEASPTDRRFRAPEWRSLPYFSLVRQSYLLAAEYLTEFARLPRLALDEQRRLAFLTRQIIEALAPTNFLATNPEALRCAFASDGATLVQGIANLAADLSRGRITMSDESGFAPGRNLAVTPGAVVFRNELIELIQYAPSTERVFRRPLLLVPPCINKYYILDLQPSNSFVRHAVAEGHTCFMISWRNVGAAQGALTWDDYLEQGVLAAMTAARRIAGSRKLNVLGFCVGGTLLASALAVFAARGDRSVASATLLTTMLDFVDPGEIGVYVSREFVDSREPALCSGQVLPGRELASAFASLRPNELVWNYVVGNYLKGETPPPFDLLYWNGDSANLPGPMYAYYLRNMYLDNRLREPGALTMLGVPVDLGRIELPTYIYASREDHIVPWRSAYETTRLVGGSSEFVLGASGHIAGVVNPPEPPRRHYWTALRDDGDAESWLARATQHPGSWWPHWSRWLAAHGGARRPAPSQPGNAKYPSLEPAPGRYVLEPPR